MSGIAKMALSTNPTNTKAYDAHIVTRAQTCVLIAS